MIEKLIKLAKKWIGEEKVTDEIAESLKALPEETQKSHVDRLEILEKYNEDGDMPEDIKGVVASMLEAGMLTKKEEKEPEITVETFIEKAGAVFSKATKAQIEKVIGLLKALVGASEEEEKKKKSEQKNLTEEQIEMLGKAEKIVAAEEEKQKKEKSDRENELLETIKGLKKDVEDLKKTKGKSAQIGDEEEVEEEGKNKKKAEADKFPSIRIL